MVVKLIKDSRFCHAYKTTEDPPKGLFSMTPRLHVSERMFLPDSTEKRVVCQCWLAWAENHWLVFLVQKVNPPYPLNFVYPGCVCLYALQNNTQWASVSPVWSIWWAPLTAHYTTTFMEVSLTVSFSFADFVLSRLLNSQYVISNKRSLSITTIRNVTTADENLDWLMQKCL